MGSDSYLAVAAPGVVAAFCSLPHGAGRIVEKDQAAKEYDPQAVEALVRARGVRLYRYDADNIAGQSPESFKDVRRVVEAMSALRMMRPVARLSPVAVLKG
jgi:tRNA-splicing ligase RtcB